MPKIGFARYTRISQLQQPIADKLVHGGRGVKCSVLLVAAMAIGSCSSEPDPLAQMNTAAGAHTADGGGEANGADPLSPPANPQSVAPVVPQAASGVDGDAGGAGLVSGAPAGRSGEGANVWAVVVAGASQPHDTLLSMTVDDLAAVGYQTTPTNCNQGAAEALGMAPAESFTVSVHFETEAEAASANRKLEAAGLGGIVAMVKVKCPT